ncbi:LysR family transcriptional regulator [Labrenzia sp. PHM005]|nr:LysR family transcriptional regulator [Labrenzia sp. PHM005]
MRICSETDDIADQSCNIADMDWDDLKCVIAFRRAGSLDAAAKKLGINATTIARRIRSLESHFGQRLVERGGEGRLGLTETGLKVAGQAEAIEQITGDLEDELSNAKDSIAGLVRLSSVPMVINHLLIPRAHAFLQSHPDLRLNLDSENRTVSLINRETDIALRLARPVEGGHSLKTQRICSLVHSLYMSSDIDLAASDGMNWIGYQETMHHLPQAAWLQNKVTHDGGVFSPVAVCDFAGATEAVAAGLGKSVLPRLIADQDQRLQRLPDPVFDLKREVWLVYRAEDHRLMRIQTVCDWLAELFGSS